jgi:hypothetical protein
MIDIEDLFKGSTAGENGQGSDLNAQNQSPGKDQTASRSPLISLRRDLDFYRESIREVALEILEAEYTAYPIFIAHQHAVNVGEIILDRDELGTNWTIQVSCLEEFVEKNIIKADKKDKFILNFKDPKAFMCLFVVVPEGANFVFNPYEIDSAKK